jgi:hypothetical protein
MKHQITWWWVAKAILKLNLILLLIFLAAIFYHEIKYRYAWVDAVYSAILWPVESTRWKEGFSEEKFDIAGKKSTSKEVIEILGTPLSKACSSIDESCTLRYTWTGRQPCCDGYEGFFHRREFYLDGNNRVTRAVRGFDVD